MKKLKTENVFLRTEHTESGRLGERLFNLLHLNTKKERKNQLDNL